MDVSVIIPTYNESENLPVIIPRIVEVLHRAGLDGEVIVVDDGSPDGTAAVARSLAEHLPVRVLARTERGLASAVLAGFALSDAVVVAVIDADGSHPVERLPDLVGPILADEADVTVGSRRLPGGAIEAWPWHRQLVSRVAGLMTWGLTELRDPTSGFMAVRRARLATLQLDPVGWKIVLEVVVKAGPARLREVAITFTDRRRGTSKLDLRVQYDYLRHLVRLHEHRRPALVQFAKFCLVGSLGVLVDVATVVGLRELFALDHWVCAAGGFVVAVSHNYLLNRYWTFPHGRRTSWLDSYLGFVATCSVGLVVRLGIVHALVVHTALGAGRGYVLANLVGIVAATVVNFVGARAFAFSTGREPPGVDRARGAVRTAGRKGATVE